MNGTAGSPALVWHFSWSYVGKRECTWDDNIEMDPREWHLKIWTVLNRFKLGYIFVCLLWPQWQIFDFLTKSDRENKEVKTSPKSSHVVNADSVCYRWCGDEAGVQQLSTTLCWLIVPLVCLVRVSVTALSEPRTVFLMSQNRGHVVQNWNCLMGNTNFWYPPEKTR